MAVVVWPLRQREWAAGVHFHAGFGQLSQIRGDFPHSGDRVAVFELLQRGDEHLQFRRFFLLRQEHFGFDVHEVRRHLDKLACDFKIHLLHLL